MYVCTDLPASIFLFCFILRFSPASSTITTIISFRCAVDTTNGTVCRTLARVGDRVQDRQEEGPHRPGAGKGGVASSMMFFFSPPPAAVTALAASHTWLAYFSSFPHLLCFLRCDPCIAALLHCCFLFSFSFSFSFFSPACFVLSQQKTFQEVRHRYEATKKAYDKVRCCFCIDKCCCCWRLVLLVLLPRLARLPSHWLCTRVCDRPTGSMRM